MASHVWDIDTVLRAGLSINIVEPPIIPYFCVPEVYGDLPRDDSDSSGSESNTGPHVYALFDEGEVDRWAVGFYESHS
jgi:hypothetical protein